MNMKTIFRVMALVMTVVMCFGATTTAYATENLIENHDDEVAAATYEVLMSTTIQDDYKVGYFYVPESSFIGNNFYFTFSGDSDAVITFSVYDKNNDNRANGMYNADGTEHKQHLWLSEGEYEIRISSSKPNSRILCVVSYDR